MMSFWFKVYLLGPGCIFCCRASQTCSNFRLFTMRLNGNEHPDGFSHSGVAGKVSKLFHPGFREDRSFSENQHPIHAAYSFLQNHTRTQFPDWQRLMMKSSWR